ncbi:hypothetical protein [Nocardia veterana]|uniref:hypothetical protein n=1 Tax=Nocardia veterana TaxID=132249 RepID=UPI0002FD5CFC|nr:hypothetical protein [Nocardia veterana]
MISGGADYRTAVEPFAPYVVTDGRLITEQNPAGARGVVEAVVATSKGEQR